MKKKKIAIVFGTRPEAIKMAPVILELKKYQDEFAPCIIVSAQHREMLDQVLSVFDIKPDYDLNIMKPNQTLSDITSDVLKGIETVFIKEQPDMVLVHGDTTTSFSATLAAYYQKIPVGHVEAGLRTHDIFTPFPEEGNRQLIDIIAKYLYVPTIKAKQNLINEGKNENRIFVTGNTAIDSIHYTRGKAAEHEILNLIDGMPDKKWILITMHRRENYGEPMKEVFKALLKIVSIYKDIEVIMPVHLSPFVQNLTTKILDDHPRIHLVSPLDVDIFHQVMDKSYFVLTDSGGLQEEAPSLDKPVLVLRDKTERPEGVEAGTLKVIGTKEAVVVNEIRNLLDDKTYYNKMAQAVNPYGDGFASQRIVSHLLTILNN